MRASGAGQVPGLAAGRGGAGGVVADVVVVTTVVVVDVAVVVVRRAESPRLVEHAANTVDTDSTSKTAAVALTPTCVWRISTEVIIALDEQFGEPVDAYVNGSQVWLREDGPNGVTLEWRLHPVPGFRAPDGVGTYELFPGVALALATGGTPPARPQALWEGLEVFPAYGEEVEPAPLAAAATSSLGLAPDAAGLVDHQAIGDEWERAGGRASIVDALLRQLGP
ncbi:MAG: hypothetical protein QOK43_1508 [Acidimicrobiaceae bacterium]|nr:hypothetical protein [Acidimicrobiaceae bacterium]